MSSSRQAAVLGASGFAGAELLRLLAGHPHLNVTAVSAESQSGVPVAELYPSLAGVYPDTVYAPTGVEAAEGADVVFLALPHGASQDLVAALIEDHELVVDLAADFRLKDPELYPTWYGEAHRYPELLPAAAFGLPELFRDDLPGAGLVAAAGCYVTAASLAIAPLVRAGAVEATGVIVDAASGVSGAGRALKANTHFNSVDEDFSAYGLLNHRHTPEIEQATGAQVLFTPHLAPMNRGILATCYLRPTPGAPDPLEVLRDAYRGEPFVVVSERSPSTKATLGSNTAHLTARRDPRTGWVVAICALDNLTKGAAGQAIQCANAALGYDETAGLPIAGLYP
ncbi:N-acetyl-gamma-glutamyl-phosphate reductase [Acidiferrimicrobium sp. IK]|uniref:N-acetyl-gamma-glutamyl-phosphate reductase n=1 Tax=Acidiferrimicrobium sp. IK TaxID=2871700 RepID=UPI0021CB6394|nr:N-acetyl-gamma-glutamyl-phosphate reductase [Acidiferrimicrobium sp. IK]